MPIDNKKAIEFMEKLKKQGYRWVQFDKKDIDPTFLNILNKAIKKVFINDATIEKPTENQIFHIKKPNNDPISENNIDQIEISPSLVSDMISGFSNYWSSFFNKENPVKKEEQNFIEEIEKSGSDIEDLQQGILETQENTANIEELEDLQIPKIEELPEEEFLAIEISPQEKDKDKDILIPPREIRIQSKDDRETLIIEDLLEPPSLEWLENLVNREKAQEFIKKIKEEGYNWFEIKSIQDNIDSNFRDILYEERRKIFTVANKKPILVFNNDSILNRQKTITFDNIMEQIKIPKQSPEDIAQDVVLDIKQEGYRFIEIESDIDKDFLKILKQKEKQYISNNTSRKKIVIKSDETITSSNIQEIVHNLLLDNYITDLITSHDNKVRLKYENKKALKIMRRLKDEGFENVIINREDIEREFLGALMQARNELFPLRNKGNDAIPLDQKKIFEIKKINENDELISVGNIDKILPEGLLDDKLYNVTDFDLSFDTEESPQDVDSGSLSEVDQNKEETNSEKEKMEKIDTTSSLGSSYDTDGVSPLSVSSGENSSAEDNNKEKRELKAREKAQEFIKKIKNEKYSWFEITDIQDNIDSEFRGILYEERSKIFEGYNTDKDPILKFNHENIVTTTNKEELITPDNIMEKIKISPLKTVFEKEKKSPEDIASDVMLKIKNYGYGFVKIESQDIESNFLEQLIRKKNEKFYIDNESKSIKTFEIKRKNPDDKLITSDNIQEIVFQLLNKKYIDELIDNITTVNKALKIMSRLKDENYKYVRFQREDIEPNFYTTLSYARIRVFGTCYQRNDATPLNTDTDIFYIRKNNPNNPEISAENVDEILPRGLLFDFSESGFDIPSSEQEKGTYTDSSLRISESKIPKISEETNVNLTQDPLFTSATSGAKTKDSVPKIQEEVDIPNNKSWFSKLWERAKNFIQRLFDKKERKFDTNLPIEKDSDLISLLTPINDKSAGHSKQAKLFIQKVKDSGYNILSLDFDQTLTKKYVDENTIESDNLLENPNLLKAVIAEAGKKKLKIVINSRNNFSNIQKVLEKADITNYDGDGIISENCTKIAVIDMNHHRKIQFQCNNAVKSSEKELKEPLYPKLKSILHFLFEEKSNIKPNILHIEDCSREAIEANTKKQTFNCDEKKVNFQQIALEQQNEKGVFNSKNLPAIIEAIKSVESKQHEK